MQPYQEASEESNRQSYSPFQSAAALAVPAVKAGVGAGVAGRVMSVLSKYVPPDLATKLLSKIDPRYGKFASLGQEAGHSFDEVKDFIGEKVQSGDLPNKPAKQKANIIQQESPELHQFLDQHIRGGRNPIEAAAIAQNDKRFTEAIKKLEKKHKTPWSSIIQGVFGSGEQALQQQGNAQQQQAPQQGQGLDPAVQQILAQGNALLQKFKGQP
jgi:hypothetical protein